MAEFAYDNVKNANTGHMLFELNCSFYPRVSYKENVNFLFQWKSVDELANELRKLMSV